MADLKVLGVSVPSLAPSDPGHLLSNLREIPSFPCRSPRGPEADRIVAETIIEGVGLRPIHVGGDQEVLIDPLFQIWIALAITQGRGRRLALRLIEA
jgi:hypothetical protein